MGIPLQIYANKNNSYKYIKNMLPSLFDDIFIRNRNIVIATTRQSKDCHLTTCITYKLLQCNSIFMNSRPNRFKGPQMWDDF